MGLKPQIAGCIGDLIIEFLSPQVSFLYYLPLSIVLHVRLIEMSPVPHCRAPVIVSFVLTLANLHIIHS